MGIVEISFFQVPVITGNLSIWWSNGRKSSKKYVIRNYPTLISHILVNRSFIKFKNLLDKSHSIFLIWLVTWYAIVYGVLSPELC